MFLTMIISIKDFQPFEDHAVLHNIVSIHDPPHHYKMLIIELI